MKFLELLFSQKRLAPCCVCTCGKRPKHCIQDMNLETRQRCGTCPSKQSKMRFTCSSGHRLIWWRGMRYQFAMNLKVRRTILYKSITFAYVHSLGNNSKLGLDSKVVLKVGRNPLLGTILRGQRGRKYQKGRHGGQNNAKGAKMLNN